MHLQLSETNEHEVTWELDGRYKSKNAFLD